jgi:alkylation response protein AidB-like acyl-CoA dehydrogenase
MFDFLSEEHLAIQHAAKDFAQKEIAPVAAHFDETGDFPLETVRKMGRLGFMGIEVPEEYGGVGMDTLAYVLALAEISKADASHGTIMSVNNSLFCHGILKFGTEDQKRNYLAPVASGERIGAYSLTEPMSGSDAGTMRSRAILDSSDTHYVINGIKSWVTIFDNYECPIENRLGQEGDGFKIAMTMLDAGRIGIAAQALGIAEAALDASVVYAKEREAFGKKIGQFQMIQQKLADMKCKVEASRLLIFQAALAKMRATKSGERYSMESSMAKLFASETAMWVTTEAIQIHGGMGYSKELPLERYFRDAKITEIYEGTSEIQRLVIARTLTGLR